MSYYDTNNKFKKFCINNIIKIESKDELEEIDIKSRTCYYHTFSDISFNDILLNEKSCKSTLIYDVSYKTFMGEKPLRIRLNKKDGIMIYDL